MSFLGLQSGDCQGRRLLTLLSLVVFVSSLFSVIGGESAAVNLYVASDGDDSKDCSSIANRCETIQRAVDLSTGGETIKVSTGIYSDVDTAAAGYVVTIDTDLTLVGGYDASYSEPPDYTSNTTIIDAQSNGGVLLIDGATAEIKGFTMTGGDNSEGGGAVRAVGSSTITLLDNIIVGNSAYDGGGVFVSGGSATITRNVIDGNTATWAGGLRLINNASITLVNNVITSNVASISGGGVDIACCVLSPTIMATLIGNQIQYNDGGSYGGGVKVTSTSAELINNVIAENYATDGSGLAVEGSETYPGVANLAHNSFYGDISEGSGVWADSDATIQLSNNIISNHSTGLVNSSPADATVSADYTLYFNNSSDYGSDVTSTNEVHGDPVFVDLVTDNFHIQSNSAAINAGTGTNVVADPVSDDIDNQARDAEPDIGADEFFPLELLILNIARSPVSINKGSAPSGPNQWFARVVLNDQAGDPGQAFHYITWLHVPEDWTLPWARQYSFTGDFQSTTLSQDWSAQSWVGDVSNCALGGPADSGYKWRAFRGPEESMPALVDRLDNQVNLRGGFGVPSGETSDTYGGVRLVVGTYYDSDNDSVPDQYSCDHVTVTTITVP